MSKKKIFSISSDFQLIKKPDWLDDFRKKYDQPYSYHVTLKTSTCFDHICVENLKGDLDAIAKKYHTIPVKFNELFISSAPKGKCIMIKAQKNKVLIKLQKEIVKKFSEYGSHITKEDERFEKNFVPHITIARHLSLEQLKIAKTELKKDLFCEALIKELVLTTVKNNRFEESCNPLNKAYFKLINFRNVQS